MKSKFDVFNSSSTVMSKEQFAVFPSSSVDSKEIVCTPIVNCVPGIGF